MGFIRFKNFDALQSAVTRGTNLNIPLKMMDGTSINLSTTANASSSAIYCIPLSVGESSEMTNISFDTTDAARITFGAIASSDVPSTIDYDTYQLPSEICAATNTSSSRTISSRTFSVKMTSTEDVTVGALYMKKNARIGTAPYPLLIGVYVFDTPIELNNSNNHTAVVTINFVFA